MDCKICKSYFIENQISAHTNQLRGPEAGIGTNMQYFKWMLSSALKRIETGREICNYI